LNQQHLRPSQSQLQHQNNDVAGLQFSAADQPTQKRHFTEKSGETCKSWIPQHPIISQLHFATGCCWKNEEMVHVSANMSCCAEFLQFKELFFLCISVMALLGW